MLILAGLGNPGDKYRNNRHNIGFMAADAIARRWRFGPERAKFQSVVSEGVIETPKGEVRALLMKPQTYMNESGRAVGEAARFYKVPPGAGDRLPRRDRPGARPLPHEDRRRRGGPKRRALADQPPGSRLSPRAAGHRPSRRKAPGHAPRAGRLPQGRTALAGGPAERRAPTPCPSPPWATTSVIRPKSCAWPPPPSSAPGRRRETTTSACSGPP